MSTEHNRNLLIDSDKQMFWFSSEYSLYHYTHLFILGAQKNRLSDTAPMSTHNIYALVKE